MSRGWAAAFLIVGLALICGGWAMTFHGDGPIGMMPIVCGGVVTGAALRTLAVGR